MIKVLKAGFYTTIQDLGRVGYASIGVPVSGVMDSFSASLVNQILGNKKTDAIIELFFGGCQFLFESETIICVSGADFSAKLNDNLIQLNTAVKVNKNDVLIFGEKVYGTRSYVGVLGGIQTDVILNSRSYYKGITQRYQLYKGQELQIKPFFNQFEKSFSSIKINTSLFTNNTILCDKGPEYDLLSQQQKQAIENTIFTVSSKNSRMGYQLNEIISNDLPSILTSAVLTGTVQLTPAGTLIILMRDCQVTGGYPRVLQLSEKAINTLAQKSTNDQFKFILYNI